MEPATLKLRTSIKNSLKRYVLFRGTIVAAAGMIILVISAATISPSVLRYWGLPILFLAGLLITIGLLPYRRLCRLELKPDEIIAVGGTKIHFVTNGKHILTIPKDSIARLEYYEGHHRYGIGIWLHHPPPEKIIIHDRQFNIIAFEKKSRREWGCDLFLAYFSKNAFESLKDFL